MSKFEIGDRVRFTKHAREVLLPESRARLYGYERSGVYTVTGFRPGVRGLPEAVIVDGNRFVWKGWLELVDEGDVVSEPKTEKVYGFTEAEIKALIKYAYEGSYTAAVTLLEGKLK